MMRGRRMRWQMAAMARPTRKINESDVNINFPPFFTGKKKKPMTL